MGNLTISTRCIRNTACVFVFEVSDRARGLRWADRRESFLCTELKVRAYGRMLVGHLAGSLGIVKTAGTNPGSRMRNYAQLIMMRSYAQLTANAGRTPHAGAGLTRKQERKLCQKQNLHTRRGILDWECVLMSSPTLKCDRRVWNHDG
eukprot:3241746-Rhodomonas_salina.1